MASVAIFDINETTLDLGPVRDTVNRLVGHEHGFGLWFGRLLQTSMAVTAAGRYQDFGALAKAAFVSVVSSSTGAEGAPGAAGTDGGDERWAEVATAMAGLAPHPDVGAGLERMAANGWRLIALTNSGQASVDAQLTATGLHDRFEAVLSVEAVQAFKPAAAPYRLALETAAVNPEDAVMVAAHDWDLAGAKAVGMTTAFVARPEMPFSTAYPPADHVVADFGGLADVLGASS